MQQRYIWLAGSFPSYVVQQGRGHRTPKLMYALDDEDEAIVIFGYSNPLYFMANKGLFRKLQDTRNYQLTEAGERLFHQMLIDGVGGYLNEEIRKTQLAPRDSTR